MRTHVVTAFLWFHSFIACLCMKIFISFREVRDGAKLNEERRGGLVLAFFFCEPV